MKRAINTFKKDSFGLISNAVFVNTVEQLSKHVNVLLVSMWYGRYQAEDLIFRPIPRLILGENLVEIEMNKSWYSSKDK